MFREKGNLLDCNDRMPLFHFLFHIIDGTIRNPVILSLTIILGTLVMEDMTTVVVALLAADGVISIPLALGSLYVGVVGGDVGFYTLGWLASTSPRLARYVDHEFTAPFRAWLETRFVLTVFTARFIPGARLPTYASSGFFRSPFATFLLVAIGATFIWTTLLFSLLYWFGSATSHWLVPVRWGIALAALLALFFIGRHNILAYRSKMGLGKPDTGGDTRAA